ncbi:UNVERIFIED_CONTAM: hypothetical protein FKN15_007336 [Acipenser sinensis]
MRAKGNALGGVDYEWDNKAPVTFTHWDRDQPDNQEGSCVSMTSGPAGGFWDDQPCDSSFPFVCEAERNGISPPPPITTEAPSEGCANGWKSTNGLSHCYKFFLNDHSKKRNWQSARQDCLSRGAELVSIHSSGEQRFLSSGDVGRTAWIGLQNDPLSGASCPAEQFPNVGKYAIVPPQGGRWPEPQKGELPATKKGEEVWRPLSPAAVSLQEFLWPEPHKGELPAMKKGEVGGPPAPAAFSLQELLWPEPHKGELPAMKKGEVGGPPAPAAFSLQELLWPEPHKGELPAMKKGEVGGPPAPAAFSLQELLWPEPHKGELPAMKKGEVGGPPAPAAFSLQELLWPEPHKGELPAMKKGEVGGPPAPAAFSLQELLWPEPHKGELPAMKKGEVGGPPAPAAFSLQELLWPEPHKGELPAMKKGEVGGPPAPAAFSLQDGTSMLSAVPLPAGVLTAWPAMGPLKPPFPARDYVLDCWIFKGGGGR